MRAELKKYNVTIHQDKDAKDGGGDVFIGWNGKQNLYQRGVPVMMDENFLGVLKHTVIETVVKGEDGKMRDVKIPRYSFSVEPA